MWRVLTLLSGAVVVVTACGAPGTTGSASATSVGSAGASPLASVAASEPALSGFTDGDELAYVQTFDLWASAADGSGAHQLTNTTDVDGGVAWAPDGQRLAFIQGGDIHVMDADGRVAQITEEGGFAWPSWSPDGTRMATDYGGPGGTGGIAIISVNDGSFQALDAGLPCAGSPDWGPGAKMVFTGAHECSEGGEVTALYTIRADGTHLTKLFGFEATELGSGSWSPDGRLVAFQADEDSGCIYVVNADGTDVRRVKPTCVDGFQISWSPDGQQLAWAGGGHGPAQAYVIGLDETSGRGEPIGGLEFVSYLDWRPEH